MDKMGVAELIHGTYQNCVCVCRGRYCVFCSPPARYIQDLLESSKDLMSPRTTAEVRFMENSPLLYIDSIQNFHDHARGLGNHTPFMFICLFEIGCGLKALSYTVNQLLSCSTTHTPVA